jgi:outer membrane protein assembly factor BamD
MGLAGSTALRDRLLAGLIALGVTAGCATSDVDLEKLSSPSDQVVWEAGLAAVEEEAWEPARQYFRRIIDAFPQSRYQPQARIALADAYLAQGGPGNAILAVSQFRDFLNLYPSAEKADYAQFQSAEAYFSQKNAPDRDQTSTLQALEEFTRLLDVYPDSPFIEPARVRIRECRQTLALSQFQVGYFYAKTRKAWRASISRYEKILRDYPDFDDLEEVLFRLGEAQAAAARFAEARPTFARLKQEYPKSKWLGRADEILAKMPEMAAPIEDVAAPAAEPAPTNAASAEGPPPEL